MKDADGAFTKALAASVKLLGPVDGESDFGARTRPHLQHDQPFCCTVLPALSIQIVLHRALMLSEVASKPDAAWQVAESMYRDCESKVDKADDRQVSMLHMLRNLKAHLEKKLMAAEGEVAPPSQSVGQRSSDDSLCLLRPCHIARCQRSAQDGLSVSTPQYHSYCRWTGAETRPALPPPRSIRYSEGAAGKTSRGLLGGKATDRDKSNNKKVSRSWGWSERASLLPSSRLPGPDGRGGGCLCGVGGPGGGGGCCIIRCLR